MARLHVPLIRPVHWRRNTKRRCRQPPLLVCSPRLEALRRCLGHKASHLHSLNDLEAAILPCIASFCAGLVVLVPCTCCQNEPIRYCGQQAMSFRTGPITGTTTSEQKTRYESYPSVDSSVPYKVYQGLDTEDFLYYSESHPFSWLRIEDVDYTEESKKKLETMKASYIRVGGNLIQQGGVGYLICTSQGIYSNRLNVKWASLEEYQIICRRTKHTTKYYLKIQLAETKQPFPTTQWCYLNDDQGNCYEKEIDVMGFEIISEYTELKFRTLDNFKEFMRIFLGKRQKSVQCQPIPGRLCQFELV